MPRKYIKKTSGPNYTQEDLKRAVSDVTNKNRTYKEAEDMYGVPKAVIFHRIKGRQVSENKMGAGRSTVLSNEIEHVLENCIKARARMGYPCNKQDIKNLVGEYVKLNPNLKTPFKNGVPGDDWYYGFMQRHPSLSFKKTELLQKARKDARNPVVIYEFYEELQTLVLENGLNDRPEFVFNTDESGFATDPKRLKAIGEKGKPLNRISGGSGRESITVLATISADGFCMPPLIVFKGVSVQARWTSPDAYPGTLYTTSSNGWMEEPQFFEWFSSAFVKHVKIIRLKFNLPQQTALLLFDGHASHISFRIIQTALDNNIHLVKFPSHLTDKIQPLDKCVFGPVKTNWEKKLITFATTQIQRKDSGHLPKNKFVELLGTVWTDSMKSENIIKGFLSTGIFPVDAKKFPEAEFNPLVLKKYKEKVHKTALHISEVTVINQEDPAIRQTTSDTFRANQNEPQLDLTTASNTPVSHSFLSTDNHSPQPSTSKISDVTPTKIIEIFTTSMQANMNVSSDALNKVIRKVVPRLKPVKYGEILTTQEVLQKQKEAEDAKKQKAEKKSSNQLGKRRPKPDCNTSQVKEMLLQDSSDDNMDDFNDSIISQNISEISYETPVWTSLKIGLFLLVDFLGGKRKTVHYKYVCSIHAIDEETGDLTVLGYRRHDKFATEFKLKENDISSISFDMIQAILPEPKVIEKDRSIIYVFPGTISVFEK